MEEGCGGGAAHHPTQLGLAQRGRSPKAASFLAVWKQPEQQRFSLSIPAWLNFRRVFTVGPAKVAHRSGEQLAQHDIFFFFKPRPQQLF
ncbi:Uncharacterized protein APZ42_015451 [Daphnia magna]|uniref:Uncharacterized protein n=1 Tax=Daphnia magna TaxID=35525 RepID=A0A162PHD7_9CRUS|nr:Uncharacterized protein APZ42_015451 [Daphnia magna]